MSGTCRFRVKGKLAPRYVGLLKIIDRKGEVAYQLELAPQLLECTRCVSRITAEKVLTSASEATTNGIS
jgi:hypothetical protein